MIRITHKSELKAHIQQSNTLFKDDTGQNMSLQHNFNATNNYFAQLSSINFTDFVETLEKWLKLIFIIFSLFFEENGPRYEKQLLSVKHFV